MSGIIMSSVAKHFDYKEVKGSEMAQFKLNSTKFKGVIFSFGRVRPEEDEVNDVLKMKYDIKFHSIPKKFKEEELLKNEEFQTLVGQFLMEQIDIYLATPDVPGK